MTAQGVTFQIAGEPIDTACSIAVENVDFVSLSPLGTYFIAWSRVYKGDKGVKNLRVWHVADRTLVAAFVCPRQPADEKWPLIKFSKDESFAARAVSNEVHFFEGCKLAEPPTSKIRLPKVHLDLSWRRASAHLLFALGAKGQPGRCNMYRMGQFDRVIASGVSFVPKSAFFSGAPTATLFSSDALLCGRNREVYRRVQPFPSFGQARWRVRDEGATLRTDLCTQWPGIPRGKSSPSSLEASRPM